MLGLQFEPPGLAIEVLSVLAALLTPELVCVFQANSKPQSPYTGNYAATPVPEMLLIL